MDAPFSGAPDRRSAPDQADTQWLTAGVIEDGRRVAAVRGTPQGAVISPLLANIYLHYALDLWAHQWRQRRAAGDVILVRYADDSVMGFQYKSEAKRFLASMRERLAKFKLELHPDKTRLIRFGRYAALRNSVRSATWESRKPSTFSGSRIAVVDVEGAASRLSG